MYCMYTYIMMYVLYACIHVLIQHTYIPEVVSGENSVCVCVCVLYTDYQ